MEADLNHDGKVSEEEITLLNKAKKSVAQTKMAYISLFAMIFVTAMMFLPVFPDSRIKALGDILALFYIAQAGVVGAYMGVTAWMNKGK